MTADKEYKAVSWISHYILPPVCMAKEKFNDKERLNFIFHYFANTFIILENYLQTPLWVFLLNITIPNYKSVS
jgi:hypothetical protein